MIRFDTKKEWEALLKKDEKLKELAKRAKCLKNYKRAKELNGCFAINCGDGVVKNEEERDLAEYLFILDDGTGLENALMGRILAARAAGISINDL